MYKVHMVADANYGSAPLAHICSRLRSEATPLSCRR